MSYPYTLIMFLFLIPAFFIIAFYWAIKSLKANRNATKCLPLKIFAKKIKLLLYLPAPILMFFLYGWIAPLNLGEDVARTAIFTIAGVVGGIIAIVFSMMLLIIGRIASKYSSKFLHYVPHNKIYITIIIYSATLIMACVFPLPLPDFYLLRIILSAFALFLEMLVLSFKETIRLMNPRYSILDPEVHNIKKWLNKEITKTETNQTKIIPTVKARSVPDDIEKQLEEKMLPIRDIIIRSISSENLQEATDSIDAFTKVALAYLESRRNFYDENDKFIYFVYTEFQNIASSATQTKYLHLRLHPVLIDSLQKISEKALEVHVGITSATSTNNLIAFPTKQIQQLCLQNLNNQNSFAPASACAALERIGLKALENGYIREAASITEMLSQISNIALAFPDLHFLSSQANTSIMRISVKSSQKRFALRHKDSSEFAIETMIDNAIKESALAAAKQTSILFEPLEPFVCQLYEMSTIGKFSLPILVRSLLYDANHPWLINKGLDYIENNIYSRIFELMAKEFKTTDVVNKERFIDTIYLCQIYLLSIFNSRIKATFLGTNTKEIKTAIDTDKVIRAFEEGIKILWGLFSNNDHRQYDNDHTLDAIFSLLIACLADKHTDKNFANHMTNVVKELYQDYCSEKYTSRDTFFKYCRMLDKAAKTKTGRNEDIIIGVPKYEDEPNSFPFPEKGDRGLPFGDPSEKIFFESSDDNQQWKILGSHTIQNKYFDDLNSQIWEERENS